VLLPIADASQSACGCTNTPLGYRGVSDI
jgi:hypothetical protein